LGGLTVAMAEQLQRLILDATGHAFRELNAADERVDELHRRLMLEIVRDDWPYGVAAATNLALLGRFYERFADQAVSTGRRLDFAFTGQLPD
jgi:phosphate transport system protein